MTTTAARLRASQASDVLTVALLTIASQGLRTHCSDPTSHHLWTSEYPQDRAIAAAVANDERAYVWGGRDFTRGPGRPKTAA